MKRVEAIIRPQCLESVEYALATLGCGVRVDAVLGQGVQGGISQMWRRSRYVVDLLPKTRVVLLVPDDKVETVVGTIVSAARTGRPGDGKVFVTPVEDVA